MSSDALPWEALARAYAHRVAVGIVGLAMTDPPHGDPGWSRKSLALDLDVPLGVVSHHVAKLVDRGVLVLVGERVYGGLLIQRFYAVHGVASVDSLPQAPAEVDDEEPIARPEVGAAPFEGIADDMTDGVVEEAGGPPLQSSDEAPSENVHKIGADESWEAYVTRRQLARMMGVSVWRVDRLRKAGMPYIKWGQRQTRFKPSEAMRWASEHGEGTV